MKCAVLLLFINYFNFCHGFFHVYPKIKSIEMKGNPGLALYLTPLIEAGRIKEARNLSLVTLPEVKDIQSYSGYFTVNKRYNSNMFFWFFPARQNYKKAPVVLWLQGGPGFTSLIGLFTENGPFSITRNNKLKRRQYTWTENHSVLYIDNPVGTGYSFTDDVAGFAKNEENVGADLYTALQQFFQVFPEVQQNEFYVTGESYAGKYVPAVSYTIHKKNPKAKLKINLKGLAMGNGFSDPEHQVNYGDYLYQIGLIDTNTRDQFHKYEQEGVGYIQKKQWREALILFDTLLFGELSNGNTYFKNVTGFDNYYNYLISKFMSQEVEYMGKYIQRNDVRRAIHVGNNTFSGDMQTVAFYLLDDVMQSVAPWISELLNHYRVLTYSGQLDIIVAYPLTVNYLQNLNFSAADEYKKAKRKLWKVQEDLAGYAKVAGNLTEVMVRNAGHLVPSDQPKWALDLITRFTRNKLLL